MKAKAIIIVIILWTVQLSGVAAEEVSSKSNSYSEDHPVAHYFSEDFRQSKSKLVELLAGLPACWQLQGQACTPPTQPPLLVYCIYPGYGEIGACFCDEGTYICG